MLSQLGSPTRDSNSSGSSESDPTVFRQIRPNSKDQGKKWDVSGILGFIFVATLSEKIHAGTAGLLGGYGFQDVLNNFKLTGQGARWIHAQLDPILDALLGIGNEPLHEAIQKELVWVGCSAAFVVLATLIVQLIRTVAIKPVEGR